MKQYMTVAEDGRVDGLFNLEDEDAPPAVEGFMTEAVLSPLAGWPEPPTATAVLHWIDGAFTWVDSATLEQAQAAAWESAKKARDAAEAADFEFEGNLYQPDVPKVTGASLAALMAQVQGVPFNETWTLSDDTTVDLSAQQVMALGVTLLTRISAIHHKGRMLRSLIDNATTAAEAYSYTWESTHAE